MGNSSHNAQIEADFGGGSYSEIAKVTSSNHEKLLDLLESSEYGDDGERRTAGRVDFTLDFDINLDLANEQSHQDLYDAVRDGTSVDFRISPDRSGTVQIEATCLIGSASGDLPGDDKATESFSAENSDGTKWSYTT